MNQRDLRIFFQFVLPSVLSFALSGVYAIVDGFFVALPLLPWVQRCRSSEPG